MQGADRSKKAYLEIIKHYEKCLQKHGDNHKGVDWPNQQDSLVRYQVMLDIIPCQCKHPVTVLDFGCGLSHLYAYIQSQGLTHLQYAGLDISEQFINCAKRKYPSIPYYRMDILESPQALPSFDYILLNGVLTEKCSLGYDQMLSYAKRLIAAVFEKANYGVAFNVMSADVDWQRQDLFHLSFDSLSAFLWKTFKARFIFRKDYGLYEYTTYLFKG